MAAFVVLNSASFTHAPVAALCFLGIHAATTHRRFRSRTYRQLFQVHVTFAFVSADQFTLSIVMAKEEDKKVHVCPLPYNCSRPLYL